MKRSKMYIIKRALNEILAVSKNVKLNYSLIKNKKKVDKEIDTWSEVLKPDEKYLEYQKELKNLKRECSIKSESGAPKTTDMGEIIIDDIKKKEYAKKVSELEIKCKEAIDENTKKLHEYEDFLDEEIVDGDSIIEWHKIKLSTVPEDVVLGVWFDIISDMFIEE